MSVAIGDRWRGARGDVTKIRGDVTKRGVPNENIPSSCDPVEALDAALAAFADVVGEELGRLRGSCHRKPLNAQINADPNANTKAGGTSARRMAD